MPENPCRGCHIPNTRLEETTCLVLRLFSHPCKLSLKRRLYNVFKHTPPTFSTLECPPKRPWSYSLLVRTNRDVCCKVAFCKKGESDSCSLSDDVIQAGGDEDSWDEIIDTDFSDDEGKLLVRSLEDADLVILSTSPPPSPPLTHRTIWKILADRLNGSAFEASFADLKTPNANEAALKKRYKFDPKKRHTWTSRCGRHQVVAYFNLYVHGRIGLFTEDGFPAYVMLDGHSAENIRFVVNKLGQPLRGKMEAQLSANQTITHVKYSNAGNDNHMMQELSNGTTEQESTKEGRDIPIFGCEGWQRCLGSERWGCEW